MILKMYFLNVIINMTFMFFFDLASHNFEITWRKWTSTDMNSTRYDLKMLNRRKKNSKQQEKIFACCPGLELRYFTIKPQFDACEVRSARCPKINILAQTKL